MKKPVIIIIALLIALAGCKIDTAGLPGASNTNAGLIIGKWYIKSQGTVLTQSGVTASGTLANFGSQDFYIFNKDQSLNISEVTLGSGVGVGSYNYDVVSQKLALTDPNNQTTTADIKKLTTDSLVYAISFTFAATNSQSVITTHLAHK